MILAIEFTSFCPAQKMKFSIKDFLSKCELLRICSHILKKPLTENIIFCAVVGTWFLIVYYKIKLLLPFSRPEEWFICKAYFIWFWFNPI